MPRSVKATYLFFVLMFSLGTYFAIQSAVTSSDIDLMLSLDRTIPLLPDFIWAYHSLLPVIIFTSIFLVEEKINVYRLIAACIISTVILNIFYIYYPSFYPRSEFQFDMAGPSEWLLAWTREVDGSNNTFPSGHVTFSWIMFWSIRFSKISEKFNWLTPTYFVWAMLVSFSTLALKQHYIVDVFSGMILATLTYIISRKLIFRD